MGIICKGRWENERAERILNGIQKYKVVECQIF